MSHQQSVSACADFDRVLGINAKGVFLSMKAEIPHMIKGGAAERS